MTDVFSTIKNCSLFKGFSELEILSVLATLRYDIQSYRAGENLYHDEFEQSGSLGCVYLILTGEVSLALFRDTTLEHQLRILSSGSVFGVVLAFSRIPHSPYSYRALSDTVVMRIPVTFFDKVHSMSQELHTRVLLNFLQITEDKVAFLYQKISCLKSLTVRERIVKYLSTLSEQTALSPGYTRAQLANYLGISREALSRGLSAMKKEGMIQEDSFGNPILLAHFCQTKSFEPCDTDCSYETVSEPSIQLLQSLPLFLHLTDTNIQQFIHLCKAQFIHVSKGACVYQPSEDDLEIYFVLDGMLSLLIRDEAEHPHLVCQLERGDLIGDTSVFSSRHFFLFSCAAQTDCLLMRVRASDFLSLCEHSYQEHETILNNLFYIVSRKISSLRDKVHILSTPAARQRIMWYLKQLMKEQNTTHLELPLSREDLACYLGISRPALCKELRILEQLGAIHVHRRSVELLNTDKL